VPRVIISAKDIEKKKDKDENKNKKRCLLLSSTAAIVKTSKPVTTHHQN
jgi:hypothetical protein